jgi:superfamily I DNA/RNA helicase/mRNA-degrading endonuclease RelE of RelBE toxin-antitoxin system
MRCAYAPNGFTANGTIRFDPSGEVAQVIFAQLLSFPGPLYVRLGPGALACPECGLLIRRVSVRTWSHWVRNQVAWKSSRQHVGVLRSRRQAVSLTDAEIDRDGLAAELAACVLLCPFALDPWREGQEGGGPNRGRDFPAGWTGLVRPVEVKQTRHYTARAGYLLVRPPRCAEGLLLDEHIDDSVYVLMIGGPWAFEWIGWADRDLFIREGKRNPVPLRGGQLECIGLHWTQLYRPETLPIPHTVPAAWERVLLAETPGGSKTHGTPSLDDLAPNDGGEGSLPMTASWELNIKPAFLTDFAALPKKFARQVQQKLDELQRDPRPDGHARKKLKSRKDPVFRLRAGDYRVLYTFGPGWIRLLGVRLHHDGYEDESIDYEEPAALPPPAQHAANEVLSEGAPHPLPMASDVLTAPTSVVRPLPSPLTPALLTQLQIPEEHHSVLTACQDEDALLEAAVPPEVRMRVIEALYPRPVEHLLQEPDLVLARSEDLLRFAEGEMDLKDFLLRLDPDQKKAVEGNTKGGPLLVKGGPGVGKSVVLLHRIRSLFNQAREEGRPLPSVLLTTYTNSLCTSSRQLLTHLLGCADMRHVTVETADKRARRIASQHGKLSGKIGTESELLTVLMEARKQYATQGAPAGLSVPPRIRDRYLLDEFAWVIEGRGITGQKSYLAADRAGRGVRLTAKEREAVWGLYKAYRKQLEAAHLLSWGQVRGRAWTLVKDKEETKKFDAVLVDETQDLTPLTLGLLVELCRSPEGVCLTADANQTLYSRGFTWQHVHQELKFVGRTVLLKRNYRTTREITAAVAAFLTTGGTEDAESLAQNCTLQGPRPLLQPYRDQRERATLIAAYLRSCAVRQRLQPHTAAVLTRTHREGQLLAEALSALGVEARYMPGNQLDLDANVVKVITLHSAKGLEFPTVVVTGLAAGAIPRYQRVAEPAEQKEEEEQARRLVFVGMTRAMHNLLVLFPERSPSPFVAQLHESYWDRLALSPRNSDGVARKQTDATV